jgi:hypothetical protein
MRKAKMSANDALERRSCAVMVVDGGALAAAAFAMGAAEAETEDVDRYKLLLNWNEIRPRGTTGNRQLSAISHL